MRLFTAALTLLLFATATIQAEDPPLTLYYAPWCFYCHKVINYLKQIHKQLPLKDVQNPENKQELLRIGGKRQVPCLVIDGEALYESDEIIAWLSSHKDRLDNIK